MRDGYETSVTSGTRDSLPTCGRDGVRRPDWRPRWSGDLLAHPDAVTVWALSHRASGQRFEHDSSALRGARRDVRAHEKPLRGRSRAEGEGVRRHQVIPRGSAIDT